MPHILLRRMLPCLGPLWLAACGAGGISEAAGPPPLPPSRIINPCDAILLPPRLDEARRADLANEIESAPSHAVWPEVLRDQAGVARAVRACQTPA
jgi:hypothetical protein